jgi:hypothetical protein
MILGLFKWVDSDNINQCVNDINWQNNVNVSTRKPKKRWQKNVGLFLQNMKLRIFHNECKSILNNIMGCSPLPTMDTTKKVDPHGFNCVPKSPKVICHQTKFQHCLAWCFHKSLPYCSQKSPYDIIDVLFSIMNFHLLWKWYFEKSFGKTTFVFDWSNNITSQHCSFRLLFSSILDSHSMVKIIPKCRQKL